MTEDDARAWILSRFGTEACDTVGAFLEMVKAESAEQNLVSAASLDAIWARHAVDSAQLIAFADAPGQWIDVGTGAGFPGMVVGILRAEPMLLVEPRRRRADFLRLSAGRLGLSQRITVAQSRIEQVDAKGAIISARAVSSIDALLSSASGCATKDTIWVLPKGRNATEEVATARLSWHGMFHVEHSITDPTSSIVIASKVSRR